MVAGSLLPIAIHKGKLYFLFGKENSMEDSAKGWSDFGGGCEGNENPYQTALREGGEELTGFLGDGKELEKHIKKNGGVYHIEHNEYHSHLFFLEYDENLPKYYNLNHAFLWERMNKKVLNDSRLFEKIEIQWFSIADMKKKRNQFRGFYREIVDKFIADERNIFQFANHRCRSKKNKTSKKQESLF
uniref:Nudix hydrolase domain-containing protein n=1 Tax=viral metagenome TaxID=1070528 RepID=A0A6C0I3A9_9ZZZZ